MKFTTVFTLLTLSAASVYAAHYETNASRLARGLNPLPPARRSSTWSAKRTTPSSTPGHPRSCGNVQGVQCCNTVTHSGDQRVTSVTGLLGIVAPVSGLVGLNCGPLSAVSLSGNSCSTQPVCCDNNHFNGLVTTGCTPINVNA